MKTQDFIKMVEARQKYCRNLLAGAKDAEYTRNDDKLHNFKEAGLMLGKPATTALLGMWIKHLVSIKDMILDYENTGKVPTQKMLDDKIGDAINYLHLLEGLFVEAMPIDIHAHFSRAEVYMQKFIAAIQKKHINMLGKTLGISMKLLHEPRSKRNKK